MRGMGNMGNMQGMMKQMQKLQKEMAQTQEELNVTEFVGQDASKMVTVILTGDKKMKDIQIKPELLDPEDPEMLQDLIIAAHSQALEQAEATTQNKMGKYTQGLPF